MFAQSIVPTPHTPAQALVTVPSAEVSQITFRIPASVANDVVAARPERPRILRKRAARYARLAARAV